ncbi:MAG: hypothetical protein KAT05_08280 [Spirochaetes bacterium]|nr:hypothetical protein [Spirochaetota bacterium]
MLFYLLFSFYKKIKKIHSIKKIVILCMLIIISSQMFSIDKIDDLSFTNTDITQILKTVSEIFGVTIVPDKDVQGHVTRYFKDTSLEQTLILLLEPLGYIYIIKEGIYFVKKKPLFNVEYNEQTKLFNISSNRASLQDVITGMELASKKTILFKGSFDDLVNINIFDKNIYDSLKLLTDSLDYELKKEEDSYLVIKKESEGEFLDLDSKGKKKIYIKGNENNIQIKLKNQASLDLIIALFKKFKKKLNLLSKKSIRIPYLDINNVKFDELLGIIFQHSGQTYKVMNNVYYVYDSLSSKRANSYNVTRVYKLKNLDHTNFTMNVPSSIIPQSCYKLDSRNNVVIVFGSKIEVDFYLDYIREIDSSISQYKYRVFKLKNIDVKQIKRYLPEKYQKIKISIIEEQNMFGCVLFNEDFQFLKDFVEKIDDSIKKYKYKFKYLNPEDVLKSMLPKKIRKEQVVLNVNDSSLIFNVSEEIKEDLFVYLDSIDIPTPVIRYQLLIVEYIRKNNFKWDWGIGFKKGDKGNILDFKNWNFGAGIFNGNDGINANFDIPTVFGYYFSAFLEYQLVEEKAKIQMSTEVFGLSGETVTLTSTQTLQYKDYVTDNDTNETTPVYSSTTFGLNLEIKGRATSSDEVYMEVSARISDQLPGKSAGDAPDTSEKSVKNSIRTTTGKPVVLGGLISKKENSRNKKLPGLSDIPFIGNAFKTHNNSYSDTEFVIYIIPFVQKSLEEIRQKRHKYIKEIYEYFMDS